MKTFQIWMEGFAATGQSQDAHYIGESKGEDFADACNNFTYPNDIKNLSDEVIVKKGDKLKLDEHRDYPCIWACRLYDNETDARKYFG